MKLIINEIQNNNLKRFVKNKLMIKNLLDSGYDIKQLKDNIGLTEKQIIDYSLDIKQQLSCSNMEILMFDLFRMGGYFKESYRYNDIRINRKFNYFSGVVEFTCESNDYIITGYATPFYEGKCRLPIDVDSYEDKKIDDVFYGEYQSEFNEFNDFEFNTIQEFIDFFNYDYFELIINKIPDILDFYGEHV